MLETKEDQQKFYDNYIKNCLSCSQCPIRDYCIKNNFNNNLNMCCYSIFEKWLKDKINIESEVQH